MPLTPLEEESFFESISDLICSEPVLRMKEYNQHGNISTYHHCMNVAYYSYLLSLKTFPKADARSVARGAMLHDLFLYDWRQAKRKWHGTMHPAIALFNASNYFELNPIEEDIILSHMWPLTLKKRPRFKESVIVGTVDTWCAASELMGKSKYSDFKSEAYQQFSI